MTPKDFDTKECVKKFDLSFKLGYLCWMKTINNPKNIRAYLRKPTKKEKKTYGEKRDLDFQKERIIDYLENQLGFKTIETRKGTFRVIKPIGIKLTWYTDLGEGSYRHFEYRERGGSWLLDALEKGDWIIASHFDRMFGNTPVYSWKLIFEKIKIAYQGKLILCDMGGEVTGSDERSKIFHNILTTFKDVASIRRKDVSQRTKTEQKKRNRFLGGKLQFGKEIDSDGNLIDVPIQKEAIKMMKKLRRTKRFGKIYSYRKISAEIKKELDIEISHEGIRRILNPNIRLKYENKV